MAAAAEIAASARAATKSEADVENRLLTAESETETAPRLDAVGERFSVFQGCVPWMGGSIWNSLRYSVGESWNSPSNGV